MAKIFEGRKCLDETEMRASLVSGGAVAVFSQVVKIEVITE